MKKHPERFVSVGITNHSAVVVCGTPECLPILNCNIYIYSDTRLDYWEIKKGQVTSKPMDLGIIIKDAETAVIGAGDANDPQSYLYYDYEDSIKEDTQVLGIIETRESVLGFLCERESGEIMCFNMPLMQAGNLNSYNFFEEWLAAAIDVNKLPQKKTSEDGALLNGLSDMGLLGW